jgi:L-prolyl-PCP dehydrogenase
MTHGDMTHLSESLARGLQTAKSADGAWACLRETVLPGLPVPTELGGQGLTAVETLLVMEQVGYACDDRGAFSGLGAHIYACVLPIVFFGTPEQQQALVPRMARGELLGAHCATEPDAGSDSFASQTRVTRKDGGLVLNGQKMFISNATIADVFLVMANDENDKLGFYIVDDDLESIDIEPLPMPQGLRNLQLSKLTFRDTRLGETCRLGGPGDAMLIFSEIMRWERALILTPWLGKMRRVVEDSYHHAERRRQFGQKISDFQAVSGRLADMWSKSQMARAVSLQAAEMLDNRKRNASHSCLAKLLISNLSIEVLQSAIQISGAIGILGDSNLLRLYEYAQSNLSISGTSDMQRQHIFKSLKLEYL